MAADSFLRAEIAKIAPPKYRAHFIENRQADFAIETCELYKMCATMLKTIEFCVAVRGDIAKFTQNRLALMEIAAITMTEWYENRGPLTMKDFSSQMWKQEYKKAESSIDEEYIARILQ